MAAPAGSRMKATDPAAVTGDLHADGAVRVRTVGDRELRQRHGTAWGCVSYRPGGWCGFRLSAVPAGVHGPHCLGLGKRLGGRPAEAIAAEVQARTAQQLFRSSGISRVER